MGYQHVYPIQAKPTNPWLVLSVLCLGASLVLLNLGTLNVALPVVSRHFHAGVIASNWILLSYMLVNTVLILVFGPLADIHRVVYGYRWALFALLIATCMGTLASLLRNPIRKTRRVL